MGLLAQLIASGALQRDDNPADENSVLQPSKKEEPVQERVSTFELVRRHDEFVKGKLSVPCGIIMEESDTYKPLYRIFDESLCLSENKYETYSFKGIPYILQKSVVLFIVHWTEWLRKAVKYCLENEIDDKYIYEAYDLFYTNFLDFLIEGNRLIRENSSIDISLVLGFKSFPPSITKFFPGYVEDIPQETTSELMKKNLIYV